jgi:tRNA threonylcarbamoyladenosine biosynthesis protein TsaB
VRVLALDAATEACSVALLNGDELTGRMTQGSRSEAPQILDMVDEVLAEAGLTLSGLDGIAASVGPGAFTGVRISVAVAQGLAFGSGLLVAAVTTLEALAMPVFRAGATRALACLDARMGEVYWGCFAADPTQGLLAAGAARVGPPESVALQTDGSYQGVGRGFAAYPLLARLPGLTVAAEAAEALPNAREFARLGAVRLALGQGLDPDDLRPVYLRDKVALTSAERALK